MNIKWQKRRKGDLDESKKGIKHKITHHECYYDHLTISHVCKFDLWAFFLHPDLPCVFSDRWVSTLWILTGRSLIWRMNRTQLVVPVPAAHSVSSQNCANDACVHQGMAQGDEDAEAWNLTNAMAASSLQNSSRTMTPSSNVTWSILRGGKVHRVKKGLE